MWENVKKPLAYLGILALGALLNALAQQWGIAPQAQPGAQQPAAAAAVSIPIN